MAENLLLITIDSLRADRVGAYGYDLAVTPTIDRLAEEGTRFTEAIATSSHTKDSFPGMFSSVLPSLQGNHHVDSSYEPLASVLSNAGYRTAGFHSTPMMASYDYHVGFDEFVDLADRETKSGHSSDLLGMVPNVLLDPLHRIVKKYAPVGGVDSVESRASAEAVTSAAKESLSPLETPFFLFVHYMDVHTPYWPPRTYVDEYANGLSEERIRELNDLLLEHKDSIHGDPSSVSEAELSQLDDLYDASIRYVDDCIGQLLDSLEDHDLTDETLVVLTADHGEEFREHGGFFHGQKLYEELIKVPLVFSGAKIPKRTRSTQVSHLGLMPTILDLLGVDRPSTAIGTSFSQLITGNEGGDEFALSETTVKRLGQDAGRVISCRHESGLKLIYNETETEWGADTWELYDLNIDPGEESNLFENRQDGTIEELRRQIAELREGDITQRGEDEEVMDRLRDLGYTD